MKTHASQRYLLSERRGHSGSRKKLETLLLCGPRTGIWIASPQCPQFFTPPGRASRGAGAHLILGMKLVIEGMHCQNCVQRVRKALEKIDGVRVEDVEVGSAVLTADAAMEPAVLEAVRKAGFEPRKSE